MKLFFKIIAFVYLTSMGKLNAQEVQLCKSWRIDYSITNGKKEFPNAEGKNNKMTFYSDNKFKGYEDGEAISGKWKLDSKKKKIIIMVDDVPFNLVLKIIKLNESEFVVESKNESDGALKKVFLKPEI